jgi:hypothetical protein
MAARKQRKAPSEAEIASAVEECLKRICSRKEAPQWREFLKDLVVNNAIPLELLGEVPLPASVTPRTRFDQIYAASMALAFPGYRKTTLRALLGPWEALRGTKVWRVVFPEKFKMAHVLLRAPSFQEAFARACDYACRASVRMWRRVPVDLTVRVMFVGEKALRRHLDLRWANRVHKRKEFQLEGREFTPRQIYGARIAALGDHDDPGYAIMKYSEFKDLDKVRTVHGKSRISAVESESVRK